MEARSTSSIDGSFGGVSMIYAGRGLEIQCCDEMVELEGFQLRRTSVGERDEMELTEENEQEESIPPQAPLGEATSTPNNGTD